MKTKIILPKFYLLFIFLCLHNLSNAQDPHPDRGLYVEKFFKFYLGTSIVDPNNTILSIHAKETALLEYCRINHITHLAFYDVHTILNASSTYRTRLCSLIQAAKNPPYCINTIGATGESEDFFCNLFGQNDDCNTTSFQPISLTTNQQNLIENYSTDLITALTDASISSSDPLYPYSQFMRYIWSAMLTPFICGQQFDFMTIELEFWNFGSGFTYAGDFKKLMNDVNYIKTNFTGTPPGTPPFAQIELYLGRMTENYNNSNL